MTGFSSSKFFNPTKKRRRGLRQKQENTMKTTFSALALAVTLVATAFTGGALTEAYASGDNCKINCKDPVRGNRNGNLWEVNNCLVGKPGSYRTVDCKSEAAVHKLPTGKRGVCFKGTDGRVHYSIQKNVWKGRKFFNQFHGGRWKVNWQS